MEFFTSLLRTQLTLLVFSLSLPLYAQNQNNRLPLRDGQIKIFANGINIAWSQNSNFARDLTNFNEADFEEIFDAIQDAGGNACRWWLHTNGNHSPQFDDEGNVTGLSPQEIPNMKKALDMAYERGIVVSMCLWSFDMLQDNQGQDPQMMKDLVEDPDKTQTYIDNALVPILEEIGDHPAVMCWEIFNEPEGMTTQFGWTPVRTSMQYVQQFINLLAGAIHRKVPTALVSNGSWNFRASSDASGFHNYYRDDRLIAAGGDPDGTLDFIQVHYYPQWEQNDTSPFHNTASHWGIDKPIVIGEFPANGITDDVLAPNNPGPSPLKTIEESYEYAYIAGYAGVMSWSWSDTQFGGFDSAKDGISYLANTYTHGLTAYNTLWEGDEGSFITALGDESDDGLVLYPNPTTSDHINFYVDRKAVFQYEIWDLSGRKLLEGQLDQNKNSVQLNKLPKGIYHLRLINDSEVIVKKFIKNN